MTDDDMTQLLARAFTVAVQPVGGQRRWAFDVVTDPQEAERRAVCRKIAEDMAIAGMGWHEDALERLTRPPIYYSTSSWRLPRFPHRRCGIKSRYKGKVRYDAAA